jgi:hypothetical protein
LLTLFSDHRGPNSKHLNKKLNPGQQNSNKSHDSGFSDSAASDIVLNGTGLSGLGPLGLGHHRDDRATSSQSLSQGSKPDSSEEDQPHCEVVHETRSSSGSKSGSTISNKQYHVSKVYFYSVSDVLQQEGSSPIGKTDFFFFRKGKGLVSKNFSNNISVTNVWFVEKVTKLKL